MSAVTKEEASTTVVPSKSSKPKTERVRGTPLVKVVVTKEVIKESSARDSQHCIIAEAIRAAMPHVKSIAVDLATIRFSDPIKLRRYTYLTPRVAQVELVKFDQGNKTKPFEFVLRAGMVNMMGSRTGHVGPMPNKAVMTPAREAALKKARLVHYGQDRNAKRPSVPTRTGGREPPTQKMKDGVPFSRRRAFGLRGLEL